MHRATGRRIAGIDHLIQSIGDILSTPLGTRLARRNYGSLLPALLDQPANAATRLRCTAAIAAALMRWEPRLRVTHVALDIGPAPGQASVTVQGDYLGAGAVTVTAPLRLGAA